MSCACDLSAVVPFELPYFVGDTVPLVATVTADSGGAYDLTGCSIAFTVLASEAAGAAILWDRSLGSGISILVLVGTPTAPAKIAIQPTLGQSQALTAGTTYPAKLLITDATGAIQTTATGWIFAS